MSEEGNETFRHVNGIVDRFRRYKEIEEKRALEKKKREREEKKEMMLKKKEW